MKRLETMRAYRKAIREVERSVYSLTGTLKSKSAEVEQLKQEIEGLVIQRLKRP